MTRRIVWIGLLVVGFGILLGTWFLTSFEQVPVDEWTPPGREARQNPYLAMERFLTAMHRPLTRAEGAASLNALPTGGVLILDQNRRAHMTPERVEALLAWVEEGGYLIVIPELPGIGDPVLEFFQVNCDCGDDEEEAPPKEKKQRPPKTVDVEIPGASRPLKINFHYGSLKLGKDEPDWRVKVPGYPDQMLHFSHGDGHVTMISGFSRLFNNRAIGEQDHAELLWTLLETYQPDRSAPITFMTRLSSANLWDWLTESAWTATISALVLLLLWLWSVVPRFGLPRPEPEPGRRQMGEHLAAVGRYVWRVGGLDVWLEIARESFRARLAQRHPALLNLAPQEQARALAELTRRPASLIAAALHEPARSPLSFTQALRTLRNLERTL